MKRWVKIKVIALMLVVLLGTMAVSATERPFSFTGKGVANIIASPDGSLSAEVIGSGNASHLGLFTSKGQVKFVPDPNDPDVAHSTGQTTFTAADGDKLEVIIEDATMNLLERSITKPRIYADEDGLICVHPRGSVML